MTQKKPAAVGHWTLSFYIMGSSASFEFPGIPVAWHDLFQIQNIGQKHLLVGLWFRHKQQLPWVAGRSYLDILLLVVILIEIEQQEFVPHEELPDFFKLKKVTSFQIFHSFGCSTPIHTLYPTQIKISS